MRTGRPKLKFLSDPDRHLMALALAYKALGMSLRGGCEAAVATVEGLPVAPNTNRGHGGRGLIMLNWQVEPKRRPGAAATIEGRARGLRKKLKKMQRDPEASRWLLLMGFAYLVAMEPAAPGDPAAEIIRLTSMAGEPEAAGTLLSIAELRRLGCDPRNNRRQ